MSGQLLHSEHKDETLIFHLNNEKPLIKLSLVLTDLDLIKIGDSFEMTHYYVVHPC